MINPWIRVTDQRPELDTPVWCLNEATGHIFIGGRVLEDDGWVWTNTYGHIYQNAENKWEANDFEFDDEYTVTHWQELPTPFLRPTADTPSTNSGE